MAERRKRTAEEREAARLERERRRAKFDAYVHRPAEPDADLQEPELDADLQEPEPDADVGESELDLIGEDGELPSGTRWVRGVRRTTGARPAAPVRPARRARPPRGGASAQPAEDRSRRHSLRGRIIALVALVVAVAIVWFLIELFQPFHGSGQGSVTVVIPPHSSVGKIGSELERDGVISSSFFFGIRATLAGDRSKLRSGTYHLKRDMSYSSVLTVLTTPPPPARVTDVTLIPGKTRRQIDRLLRSQGVRGSYYAATRSSRLLNPTSYGAPRGTDSLEGFLYPDTFQLREPISVPALVADQLNDFKRHFATVNMGYARRKHLTPYSILIVASMIEGEAQTAKDRALVASVIYNRLAQGGPLGIDATTCYLVGGEPCNLSHSSLLKSRSPYNTRIHAGLPPTPIDNPSLASIEAAAHPANTNYLYFVVKPCGNGSEFFTSSYSQFLQASARYQSARAARGGRSPSHC